jgi:hypothetical protein
MTLQTCLAVYAAVVGFFLSGVGLYGWLSRELGENKALVSLFSGFAIVCYAMPLLFAKDARESVLFGSLAIFGAVALAGIGAVAYFTVQFKRNTASKIARRKRLAGLEDVPLKTIVWCRVRFMAENKFPSFVEELVSIKTAMAVNKQKRADFRRIAA